MSTLVEYLTEKIRIEDDPDEQLKRRIEAAVSSVYIHRAGGPRWPWTDAQLRAHNQETGRLAREAEAKVRAAARAE